MIWILSFGKVSLFGKDKGRLSKSQISDNAHPPPVGKSVKIRAIIRYTRKFQI